MSKTLAWGIIGTGIIANTLAEALSVSTTSKLLAVASRTQAAAERFSKLWNVPRIYSDYESILVDQDIDVVYIAIPHPMHSMWAIKAASAGKHILCEKPLGMNYTEAASIVDAARRHNVFLSEAFMYRFHPQTAQLLALLYEGVIGDVRVIQATFSIQSTQNPEERWLNNTLGGGAIMDVGCYCTSFARLVAGAANGKAFMEPTKLTAMGYIGNTNVDEYALASLEFSGGILAQLFCGIQIDVGASATIYGSKGSLHLSSPFFPPPIGMPMTIVLKRNDEKEPRVIVTDTPKGLYTLEVDAVALHINEKQAPEMPWEDSLGNMLTLDQWRAAIGLVYK